MSAESPFFSIDEQPVPTNAAVVTKVASPTNLRIPFIFIPYVIEVMHLQSLYGTPKRKLIKVKFLL